MKFDACSVRVFRSVFMKRLLERDWKIVAIFSPNIICCVASDDDGSSICYAFAIPLQQDDGAFSLKLFDLRNEFVDHVGS